MAPRRTSVDGKRDLGCRLRQSELSVRPCVHDLVRRVGAGGSAVCNVDARHRREVGPGAGGTVEHATADHRVHEEAGIGHRNDVLRLRPRGSAVVGLHEGVRSGQRASAEVREERVDDPVAVSSDRTAVVRTMRSVRRRRRDLLVAPGDAAVGGRRDDRKQRKCIAAAQAVEVHVADVHVPEEGTRRGVSAQICSLSSPAVADACVATKDGLDQFCCCATRAGVTLSMEETVTANVLLFPPPILVSVRFVASVEKYRREPFAQEK
jgi:hypothetical protein